jgi:hypothetical protein
MLHVILLIVEKNSRSLVAQEEDRFKGNKHITMTRK